MNHGTLLKKLDMLRVVGFTVFIRKVVEMIGEAHEGITYTLEIALLLGLLLSIKWLLSLVLRLNIEPFI